MPKLTSIWKSYQAIATLTTSSFASSDNIVIAIVQFESTASTNIAAGNLKLVRGSTTLASAEYYIFHTSSATTYGAWQVHLIPYLDSGAPASAQYAVIAKAGAASVVYGRATIIAFNKGSLSAAYVDGDGTTIDTSETTIKALSTSFSAGSDVAVMASEQFWNFDDNYNYINADLNKLQQSNQATGQTTNQYTISFGSYSSDDIGNGFGLLNRFTSAPSLPEYEVKATRSNSYTLGGEAKILALCKPPKVPEFPLGPTLLVAICFPITFAVRKWKKMG